MDRTQLLNIYGLLASSDEEFNMAIELIKIYFPDWYNNLYFRSYNDGHNKHMDCHDGYFRMHLSFLGISFSARGYSRSVDDIGIVKYKYYSKEEFITFMDKVYLNESSTIIGKDL